MRADHLSVIRKARPSQVFLVVSDAIRVHVAPVPVAMPRFVVPSRLLSLHNLPVPVHSARGPLAADLTPRRCHLKEAQSRLGLSQELLCLQEDVMECQEKVVQQSGTRAFKSKNTVNCHVCGLGKYQGAMVLGVGGLGVMYTVEPRARPDAVHIDKI